MTIRVLCMFVLASCLAACDKPERDYWQGYIEGEYLNLASSSGGQLLKLHARCGAQVVQGKPVFVLEQIGRASCRERV